MVNPTNKETEHIKGELSDFNDLLKTQIRRYKQNKAISKLSVHHLVSTNYV